jgi:hypothetical protein
MRRSNLPVEGSGRGRRTREQVNIDRENHTTTLHGRKRHAPCTERPCLRRVGLGVDHRAGDDMDDRGSRDDRESRGFVPAPGVGQDMPDLESEVEEGELTGDQAANRLQQAARRDAAEHGPSLDTDSDGTITLGGHGSGQGMEKQRTGQ